MTYSAISKEMKISDLVNNESYGAFRNYIFTYMTPDHYNCPLEEYGFDKVGFVEGLHRMEELAASDGQNGESYIHDIYSKDDQKCQWDKALAKYIHFPAKTDSKQPAPYVVIIPGGALNRQWGFIEGLAVAAHLNNLGYSAFVLYYRVKLEPVLELAVEDMNNTIKHIESHADDYNIIHGQYMIGGFSAGATVAGLIGSDNYGYKVSGLPKPEAIFLGYTAVSIKEFYKAFNSLPDNNPTKEGIAPFLRRIAGPNINLELVEAFDLPSHIDESYPKTYIVANTDDGTVPVANSLYMDKILTGLSVEHITKIGSAGGHSFGLGNGLEVEGWLDEAVQFWRN